jgi:hypothetical protein
MTFNKEEKISINLSMPAKTLRLLEGAFDMHTHPGPDFVPRIFDVYELAEQCKKLGMAGFVAKNHNLPTQGLAYSVNKKFSEVKCFGSITLNFAVGGLNLAAINVAAEMGAKVVWFPTISSTSSIARGGGSSEAHKFLSKITGSPTKGIEIINSNGSVLPKVEDCLNSIAEYNLVLATGHLTIEETIALVDAAKSVGVDKIVITHPRFPVEKQIELADRGAYIELTNLYSDKKSAATYIDNIKKIGANRCIICTDSGMVDFPRKAHNEAEYWKIIIARLLDNGISENNIATMIKINPKKLLDIK